MCTVISKTKFVYDGWQLAEDNFGIRSAIKSELSFLSLAPPTVDCSK